MLCKIVAPEKGEAVRSMVWPVIGGKAAKENPRPPRERFDQPLAQSDPDQAEKLHIRIRELEKALQSEVFNARENGFREGENAGRQQASRELEPVLERMAHSIAEMASLRSRIRRQTEKDLVDPALAISRRVLHRELSVDPEAILGLVKAALEKLQTRDLCRIRLHPGHERCIRAHTDKMGIAGGLELVADPALPLGGVVIETRRGDIDASLEGQLSEIERGFADKVGHER